MEEQQNVQLPPGTTECNHSYYTGSSFSAPHSSQQLHNGTIVTPVQPLAYTQENNGAASSGFVSSSLLSCSAISSQVTAGPTRNVTGDVMPLAEAITQLSFLEFLQRCGDTTHGASTTAAPATFSYFSFVSTAPCLDHPCGNTSCTFSHYRQEKCQYCSGGNAQSCSYRFSYRVCSFS